jgi:hypothetical protein
VYREIKRNSLGAHAIEIRRGKSRKIGWEISPADDTRIPIAMSRPWRQSMQDAPMPSPGVK